MRKIGIILLILLAGGGAFGRAAEVAAPETRRGADRYAEYIATYAEMAVEQQKTYGIPASITLAQGLLESAAGRSTLATEGNNHFGIKCHRDWQGETMLRSDDAPDECFRVYSSAAESYADHSRFLSRARYQSLFELDPEDYAAWAKGLKQCGYATDPHYADRLIAIIERYGLSGYDCAARGEANQCAEFISTMLRESHPVRKGRGLHYVIAAPGDTYAKIASEFGLKAKDLMAWNDKTRDGEIRAWQEVYLQPKRESAPEAPATVTIGVDEDLHSIAQRFGLRLSVLKALNPKAKDRPGEELKMKL